MIESLFGLGISPLFALEIDPTFGWGQVFIDAMTNFLTDLFGRLILVLKEIAFNFFSLIAVEFWVWFSQLGERLVSGFDSVGNFFSSFWVEVGKWYTFFTGVRDTLVWIQGIFTDVYNFFEQFVLWLVGENDGFGQWLWDVIQQGLTWLGEFFKQLWERSQNFVFDNGLWLYEWVIGILDSSIGYFINLIHRIFR